MKYKVKLFEWRGQFIRYEIYNGKTKVNQGWYKTCTSIPAGTIAKEIENMFIKANV